MASPAYWGKLANFEAASRKPALVAFGLFNAQDNLAFIASLPAANSSFSTSTSFFSPTLVVDTSAADVISITLTANVTSMTLNYGGSGIIPNGQRLWIRLIQDATGNRSVVLPTNLIIDQSFAVDPGANRATVLPIQYDTTLSKWKFFDDPFSIQTA